MPGKRLQARQQQVADRQQLHPDRREVGYNGLMSQHANTGRKLIATVALNVVITAVEVAGGLISGSLALVSDALHNLSDAAAALVSWLALKIGRQPRTLRRTFGTRRAEILAALLNASVLVGISLYLFVEVVRRLSHPQTIDGPLMLVVAVVGLLANGAAVLLLHGEARGSLNVRAAYLHLLSDTVSSVAVIAGAGAIWAFGWAWLDPLLTVLISLYVLREAWVILRQAVAILMMGTPEHMDLQSIQAALEKLPGVASLHHVHAWQLADEEIFFEGHLALARDVSLSQAEELRRQAERMLVSDFAVRHVTLQLELAPCCGDGLIHGCP